jgi:hypothetical protein
LDGDVGLLLDVEAELEDDCLLIRWTGVILDDAEYIFLLC